MNLARAQELHREACNAIDAIDRYMRAMRVRKKLLVRERHEYEVIVKRLEAIRDGNRERDATGDNEERP